MTLDQDTLAAIVACVRSIEELEVLLFLAGNRERYWSPAMIATEIGVPVGAAAATLETLASRNLLDVRITEAVLYKLDPTSPEVRRCLDRTLDAAWRNRSDVIRAIVRRPSAAQDFADAFRMRRRRTDG